MSTHKRGDGRLVGETKWMSIKMGKSGCFSQMDRHWTRRCVAARTRFEEMKPCHDTLLNPTGRFEDLRDSSRRYPAPNVVMYKSRMSRKMAVNCRVTTRPSSSAKKLVGMNVRTVVAGATTLTGSSACEGVSGRNLEATQAPVRATETLGI